MLKQTHTYALLELPLAVHRLIRDTLVELGAEDRMDMVENDEGQQVAGIMMDGIMLVPGIDDHRDLCEEAHSDLLIAIGEDAFMAGFAACAASQNTAYDPVAAHRKWSEYDPPEELKGR